MERRGEDKPTAEQTQYPVRKKATVPHPAIMPQLNIPHKINPQLDRINLGLQAAAKVLL